MEFGDWDVISDVSLFPVGAAVLSEFGKLFCFFLDPLSMFSSLELLEDHQFRYHKKLVT